MYYFLFEVLLSRAAHLDDLVEVRDFSPAHCIHAFRGSFSDLFQQYKCHIMQIIACKEEQEHLFLRLQEHNVPGSLLFHLTNS